MKLQHIVFLVFGMLILCEGTSASRARRDTDEDDSDWDESDEGSYEDTDEDDSDWDESDEGSYEGMLILCEGTPAPRAKRDTDKDWGDNSLGNSLDGTVFDHWQDDSDESGDKDVPDALLLGYCRGNFVEIMETRDLIEDLPPVEITTSPAGAGNDPENVRMHSGGWKVPIPADGDQRPSITLKFTTGGGLPPFVREIDMSTNAKTSMAIKRVGSADFEPLAEGTWYGGVGTFPNPIKPEMLRITLKKAFAPDTTDFNLQLAVRACYPDQIISGEED